MSVEIARPYLIILLPFLIAFSLFGGKYLRVGANKSKGFILTTRILILTFLVLATLGIRFSINRKYTTTLFLLDVSDSNKDFKAEGEKFIREAIESMPKKNKAGVIAFGENALVEQFVSKSKSFGSISGEPIVSATNIENAINIAMSTFPQDSSKRIVLISDGEENSGSLLKMVPSLKEQNIDIKVYKVDKKEKPEVYVDNIKLPKKINIGDEFSLVVNINSNLKTSAKVTLFSGRLKKGEQQVDIEKGKNSFVFKDVQNSGGFRGYKVLIEPLEDSEVKNNEFLAFTQVVDKPKLLLIEGKKGEGDELGRIFNSLNMNFKKINVKEAPRSLNEMLEYKAMISANAHADDFNKEFLSNLETYVKDYAGSFIATGGEDSFALGGYKDTPLEKVLPVEMDMNGKKEIPQMSLVLVIDHSGSMSSGEGSINKLELAKEAALKAVDTMRDKDEIGVLAFDDSYNWVVERQKSDNKEAIKKKISSIAVQGGTSIYPALEEAFNSQKESKSKIKHIILLTDGQDGFRDYGDLISKINNENITLSTVSVGEDADQGLLKGLALDGKGRSYHTDIYTDIPRIFAKEIFMSARVYLNNREFVPKLATSHNILNGIMEDGKIPSLLGYIGAAEKDTATKILASDEDDPILTAWQYGLGKSVAWNSDMSGKWSANFSGWNKTLRLWQNIINWSIENYDEEGGNLSITMEGNAAKLEYQAKNSGENLKVKGLITGDGGEKEEFELKEIEPSKYAANLKLKNVDFYNINLREEEAGEVKHSQNATVALQYSQEYKFHEDTKALETLVEDTEGSFIKFSEEVFKGELKIVPNRIELTDFFIILSLILLMIDIAYRRLNLNIGAVLRKKIKPKNNLSNVRKHKADKERVSKDYIKDKVNPKKTAEKAIKIEDLEENRYNSDKDDSSNPKKLKKSKELNAKKEENKAILDTSSLLKKKKDREI